MDYNKYTDLTANSAKTYAGQTVKRPHYMLSAVLLASWVSRETGGGFV